MQQPHENPVELDFRRRDTEGGWLSILDRFGLAAAPTWFDWLEWILILGAFEYSLARVALHWFALSPASRLRYSGFILTASFSASILRAGSAFVPFG